ncbi:MAG: molybdopterin-guanine dinucleotide biosynthesis protein B [Peptococcaceae bacterium]|jgi:molybdopterin-guanine dinucleotide biosynthesis protein B|nr:molybdopterin-guanine dinucleotide biosynthesis protein B [Peptococcaceae bacterium]
MADIPVICFVAAKSGTGKTTFLEKLIREMTSRGYELGVVKSDAHSFEIDVPGKDSWRFSQAGAKATAIIGPDKYALIQKTDSKRDLEDVLPLIQGVDIILVEGYKAANRPKIEIVRRERGTEIVSGLENLIAVVTDVKELKVPVPLLDINDYQGVADLIEDRFLTKK